MKIKDFISFLKENIREDEHSHLNDKLDINKRNEARWSDDDDDDDEYFNRYGDEGDDYDDYDTYGSKDKEDSDVDDDSEHLLYLLRTMFRNNGVDVDVTSKRGEDIVISCYMGENETLKSVIKVFEVANKLKRDILSQYDSEFEMWESKKGAILNFGFTLDEGLEDDNMPF